MPSSEDEEASVSEAASESSSEESEVEDDETGADECFTSLDQIEHEGLVFIKRKTWDRHWCTLRRNALRFYAPEESLDEDGEHEGPFYPNNVRNWEDERGKVFTRGIVLDVTDEEGKPSAIILRCDTIEDKQCWEQILTVVLELQKEAQEGEGITAHAADDQPDEESASAALSDHHAHDKDSDDSEDSDAINSDAINSDHDLDLDSDGEDGEVDLALLLQRDTLLKASEIGGPAFAVFQESPEFLFLFDGELKRRLGIQRSFGVRRVAFSKAQVDQGQEDTEWHELFASRTALGRNDPHSSSMDTHYDCDTPTTLPLSPSPAEDAFDQDDAEEAEDTKPPTGMMLLRVTCTPQEASAAPSLSQSMTSTVLEPEEDDKVPSLSMLTAHPDGAFILDCGTELFVWHGAQANRTVRLGALKVAGQLLRSSDDRPSWADEASREVETPEDKLVRQAGAASDKGEGELLVWRISYQNPKGVAFVEDEYVGNFSSTCSYVLLYGFADEQSGTSTTGTDASDHEGTDLDSDAEENQHRSEPAVDNSTEHANDTIKSYTTARDNERSDDEDEYESAADEEEEEDDVERLLASRNGDADESFSSDDEGSNGSNTNDESDSQQDLDDGDESQCSSNDNARPHGHRGMGNAKGKYIVYYWQWKRVMGDLTVGREPEQLRRLFASGKRSQEQRICVHERQWRRIVDPDWRVSLFKAFQVPPTMASFSSKNVYAMLQEEGSGMMLALLRYHGLSFNVDLTVLDEQQLLDPEADQAGLEDMIEHALGQSMGEQYADYRGVFPPDYDVDEDPFGDLVPRLYVLDTRSGQTVAILTAPEAVYVWKGPKADEKHYNVLFQPPEVAKTAAAAARRYSVVKAVLGGKEPLEFKAHFQCWDDAPEKAYVDVYEQRLAQRANTNQLGDAQHLRGRVLGDDEAKHYWSAKQSTVQLAQQQQQQQQQQQSLCRKGSKNLLSRVKKTIRRSFDSVVMLDDSTQAVRAGAKSAGHNKPMSSTITDGLLQEALDAPGVDEKINTRVSLGDSRKRTARNLMGAAVYQEEQKAATLERGM
ncbi:hypothetical protein JKP88DRAFT_279466 [Tribonema minus]|uniref:PH domain-containing protein n=1 Tax=Tribonema minus TaxID=303371 RepID=A0A835YST9_9STRA|nr:hypothetical protein JKP88DRAFT_279466 [Tribonema minus]